MNVTANVKYSVIMLRLWEFREIKGVTVIWGNLYDTSKKENILNGIKKHTAGDRIKYWSKNKNVENFLPVTINLGRSGIQKNKSTLTKVQSSKYME